MAQLKQAILTGKRTLTILRDYDLRVIIFKITQKLKVSLYKSLGIFSVQSKKIRQSLAQCHIETSEPLLVSGAHVRKFRMGVAENAERGQAVVKSAESCMKGEYRIFNFALGKIDSLNWHRDPVSGYEWDKRFYTTYNHYSISEKNENIKNVWEVSRLSYCQVLVSAYLLTKESHYLQTALDSISNWIEQNDVAYSVNWNSMECSVRAIQLLITREMLTVINAEESQRFNDALNQLDQCLLMHGHFIWLNREYTQNSGNHFMANIVALMLLGGKYKSRFKFANKWLKYAKKHFPVEVENQFYRDGVHFEKSTAYHTFVTELALVGIIVSERLGIGVLAETRARVESACVVVSELLRPDGLMPNFGDNDSAQLFVLSQCDNRRPEALLTLAKCVFNSKRIICPHQQASAESMLILGDDADEVSQMKKPSSHLLSEGGYGIIHHLNDYLCMDVGEVGQNGLGGHGHNDLLSFEYVSMGQPIIIDRGCPVYTANLSKLIQYKRTDSHNTLEVDGMTLGESSGPWRIINSAIPISPKFHEDEARFSLSAGHEHFSTQSESIIHTREIALEKKQNKLTCHDIIECKTNSPHEVKRYLHFHPNIILESQGDEFFIMNDRQKWLLETSDSTTVMIEDSTTSDSFGCEVESKKITFFDLIDQASTLYFTLTPIGNFK